MKKIIEGKIYNTDTAREIGRYDYLSATDFEHVSEVLYRTNKGSYFLYYEGGAMSKYGVDGQQRGSTRSSKGLRLMTEAAAKTWATEYLEADEYIEIFGEVEEG